MDSTTAPERIIPGAQSRPRWSRSRGPSLPSVSLLGGRASDENLYPGPRDKGLTERRCWSIVNTPAVAARDGTMEVQEGESSIISEEIPPFSGAGLGTGQGELEDGIAGWPGCGTAEADDKNRGPDDEGNHPSEQELLGEPVELAGGGRAAFGWCYRFW